MRRFRWGGAHVTVESLFDLSDGRVLAYRQIGDPARHPVVVVHHGTPGGSLVTPLWATAARDLGICLISFARPGYGASTPHEGRSVADVARDVEDLLDALGAERSAHVGWSGGGPHALASAALLGRRARRVATVGAVGPSSEDDLDFVEGMAEGNVVDVAATRDRQAEIADCKEVVAEFGDWSPERVRAAFSAHMGPEDQEALTGELLGALTAQMREGLSVTVEGWADDAIALTVPWGFSIDDVACPAWVIHGAADITVPVSHGRWLADRLGDVHADFPASEGHLGPLVTMTRQILTWLRT